ncbi:MAG TPA: sigma factor-like helix-turn-helix DNA-binding protein, partial [Actinomycetales bacterium]|nr:sigma factor-like helix-turn-helix DNA-binding protein [Actinomycetales bacterium]
IKNLSAWLTTVVGRLSLDLLRSRRVRRETTYDEAPREVVLDEPDDQGVLADSVGIALLVVLERLTPDERLAFVLHDIFAVPFAEIAEILGKSADAAKMLASRARRKVRATDDVAEARAQRKVVDAFLAAAREGDFAKLLVVLSPDVELRVDAPGGRVVVLGATEVAARAQMFSRVASDVRPVLVDGQPGIVSWRPDGTVMSVMAYTVADGVITVIASISDPELLSTLILPEPTR